MFTVIHTGNGSDWGTFPTLDSAKAAADNCARALNATFHVVGIVHVAHTIPASTAA
jgi:hypothetical protein